MTGQIRAVANDIPNDRVCLGFRQCSLDLCSRRRTSDPHEQPRRRSPLRCAWDAETTTKVHVAFDPDRDVRIRDLALCERVRERDKCARTQSRSKVEAGVWASVFAAECLRHVDKDGIVAVFEFIHGLAPSERGELEITDVNNRYIERGDLTWEILDGWWTDAGTFDSLLRASQLVKEGGANKDA